ncbi:HIT family protein [bacterium]|nr:MAG: HIT family protein [bacterium]
MASIFTRIINGEIPCYKIAENEHCFAFLDISPIAKGHTLVVPKKEIDYLFDVDDETLHHMISFAKPIAKALDKAFGAIRTGIIVEGLLVPHAHIHLVPIYSESQVVALGHHKEEISKEEMAAIAEAVRKELNG